MCMEGAGKQTRPFCIKPIFENKSDRFSAYQFGKFLELIKMKKFSYDNH
jgi:hypothetical protein